MPVNSLYLFIYLFSRHLSYACERSPTTSRFSPRSLSLLLFNASAPYQLNKNFSFSVHFPLSCPLPLRWSSYSIWHPPSARMQQRLDLGRADRITRTSFAQERSRLWSAQYTRPRASVRHPDPGRQCVCLQIGSFLSWNFYFFAHPTPYTDGPGWNVVHKGPIGSARFPNNRLLLCVRVFCSCRKKSTPCGCSHLRRGTLTRLLCSQRITSHIFLKRPTVNQ